MTELQCYAFGIWENQAVVDPGVMPIRRIPDKGPVERVVMMTHDEAMSACGRILKAVAAVNEAP